MSEPLTDDAERQLAAKILGGEAVLHRSLKGPLDVAVHKGFRALDTVPHVLTSLTS